LKSLTHISPDNTPPDNTPPDNTPPDTRAVDRRSSKTVPFQKWGARLRRTLQAASISADRSTA